MAHWTTGEPKFLPLREKELFNGDNYVSWRNVVKSHLFAAKCFELMPYHPAPVLRPTNAAAAADAPTAVLQARWDIVNQAGLYALSMSLDASHAHLAEGVTRVSDLWNNMQSEYAPRGGQYASAARTKWLNARQPDNVRLTDWIDTMRVLRLALREQAVPLDDTGELCTFVCSLNGKWETTVDTIWAWQEMGALAGGQAQFSWPRVMNLLRSKEAKDLVKEEKKPEEHHALPASGDRGRARGSGSGGRSSGGGGGGGAVCSFCQKRGHQESDCWTKERGEPRVPPKKGGSGSSGGSKARPCQRCKHEGHDHTECPRGTRTATRAHVTGDEWESPRSVKEEDAEEVLVAISGPERVLMAREHRAPPPSPRWFWNILLWALGIFLSIPSLFSKPSSASDLALVTPSKEASVPWLLDSGCTTHIAVSRECLSDYQVLTRAHPIHWGSSRNCLYAVGKGTVALRTCLPNGVVEVLRVSGVLHVPEFGVNLISVSQLAKQHVACSFGSKGAEIRDEGSGKLLCMCDPPKETKTLYRMKVLVGAADVPLPRSAIALTSQAPVDVMTLHARCAHAGFDTMRALFPDIAASEMALVRSCLHCKAGKLTRRPYASIPEAFLATAPGEVLSVDLCSVGTTSLGGCPYWLVIVCEFSKYLQVVPLKKKSDAFGEIKAFSAWASRQGHPLRTLRSDNGGEFLSQDMTAWAREHGVTQRLSAPYTPQQNGAAERANRTVLDGVRTMLLAEGVGKGFWGEATNFLTYTMNNTPRKSLKGKTPYSLFVGKPSPPVLPHAFGSSVAFWVPKEKREKLAPAGRQGLFLGPSLRDGRLSPGAYRVWDKMGKTVYTVSEVVHGLGELRVEEIDVPGPIAPPAQQVQLPVVDDDESGPSTPTQVVPPRVLPLAPLVPQRGTGMLGLLRSQMTPPPVRMTLPDSTPRDAVSTRVAGAVTRSQTARARMAQAEALVEAASETLVREPVETARGDSTVPLSTEDSSDMAALVLELEALESCLETAWHEEVDIALPTHGLDDPLSVEEALARPHEEAIAWRAAIESELSTLTSMGVWRLAVLPEDTRTVKSKWVLRKKLKADKSLDKFRARLVARGFSQTHGVDYFETYAPTVQMVAVRILLSLAAVFDWEMEQVDIKSAYLHAPLTEDVYMEIPSGMSVEGFLGLLAREAPMGEVAALAEIESVLQEAKKAGKAGKRNARLVVKLMMALYGLKQSARAWNNRIVGFLSGLGFVQLSSEMSVFVRGAGATFVAICLHVDDQNILSPSLPLILELKAQLQSEFGISDEGPTRYFLGLEIERNRTARTLKVHQETFCKTVLERFSMSDCVPAATPLADDSVQLNRGQGPTTAEGVRDMEQYPYRALVGSVMYLMVATRPDLAYAIGRLGSFLCNPGLVHWEAALRVLRYLRGSTSRGITFHAGASVLPYGYCDASYAEDILDRRSCGGHVFMAAGGPICWKAQKHSSVSRSTTEAEYVECSDSAAESVYLRALYTELGVPWGLELPVVIFSDSQGALALVESPVQRHRTKHIAVHFHYVRELVAQGHVYFEHVGTAEQAADIFTKPLARPAFEHCLGLLGMAL